MMNKLGNRGLETVPTGLGGFFVGAPSRARCGANYRGLETAPTKAALTHEK